MYEPPDHQDLEIHYPEWEPLFRKALVEVSREDLRSSIEEAEAAMTQRLTLIQNDALHVAELQAIRDARMMLGYLRKHELNS